jgi:chromosome segregation ATPase
MAAPSLRRGLFGYSRSSVREVLAERDVLVVRGLRETKEAESTIGELTLGVDEARREIADLQARNRDLEARLRDSAERFRVLEQSSSPSTTEGMTEVLQAAERALGRLTESARRNAEQELGQTERARAALLGEIDRLSSWRARVAPLSESVPRSIEDVRREASSAADRLREALAPLAAAMDVLIARLADFDGTPDAPIEIPEAEDDLIRLEETGSGNGSVAAMPRPDSSAWAPRPPSTSD